MTRFQQLLLLTSAPVLVALLLLPRLATALAPGPVQSPAGIETAAVAAAEAYARGRAGPAARIAATAAPTDPRLRLPACPAPLGASVLTGAGLGRITVEVRCVAADWRLYVPVTLKVTRPVVVAARSLARDTILAPGDVVLAEREVAGVAGGFYTAAAPVLGQRLRREVVEGTVLGPGLVLVPPLVRSGQEVMVEARAPGFAIRVAGIARRDGRLGDTIPVQNISSGQVREAVVRSAKSVEVLIQ